MTKIRALTFDFGSTLYAPRDPQQVQAVQETQPVLLQEILAEAGWTFGLSAVRTALPSAGQYPEPAWNVFQRVERLCAALGIDPPAAVQQRLVRALEDLMGQIEWQHAPGAPAVLRHFRQRNYLLGLVANTSFLSSRVIRQVLAADGTLMYFQAFSFSDEVGVYKPAPAIFEHVLFHLDLDEEPATVVHIGDHPTEDVAGAQAVGMPTVRYTGFHDQPGEPAADVVLSDFRDLPDLIHNWE